MAELFAFGNYKCGRCKKYYIVNDGTWRRCTPAFCHDCTEWLDDQYALITIDKDGKETKQ